MADSEWWHKVMTKVMNKSDYTNLIHNVMTQRRTQSDDTKWWHKAITQVDDTKWLHKVIKQSKYTRWWHNLKIQIMT